ncbi:MAG TPA: DUF4249 domain-containing protein [Haliscomenobacter sp.]|uniref:DUF4249 domain-containing protein n=1 Tax=Haliscomenobacter sp. TaxID=2717303 RepID=UPI002BBF2BA9|nr:DUF4249 domain-containing protein [Haliscomenobacter sp.]HOY16934.1 DUF4249 domain-containing protein [Haliscomenobacter sp.]
MKKNLRGILSLSLLALLFGCEKPRLSDLYQHKPRLVVISNFTTLDGIQVQVSKSRSPLDNGGTDYITNAKVEIWEGEQLLERLNLNDTREEKIPFYTSEVIKPRIGVDYTVKVSAPGFETVTATSRIPESVNLDSVLVEKLKATPDDPGFVRYDFDLAIYFTDPLIERNFYHVNVFQKSMTPLKDGVDFLEQTKKLVFGSEVNSNYIVANYDGGLLIEDKLIDGRAIRIPIPISMRMPAHLQNFDELIVELRSVSEEYYLFHSTVSRQQDNDDLPFSDPVVLFNNIRNGQGVFAGYSQAKQAVVIKPK